MNVRVEAIPVSKIKGYATSGTWKDAPVIPITPERARSQQQNPHAKQDEPCLWVATGKDDRVVGFAGSLPGLESRGGDRMGWNSCWWVDADLGREAAMPLFFYFLQYWDQRVAFADMTVRTRAIVYSLGCCHTREDRLLLGYFRIPITRAAGRLGFMGKILYPLLLPAVLLVNAVQQVRMNASPRKKPHGDHGSGALLVESRDRLDKEVYQFISEHRERDFAHRTMEEFNWIMEHPWLVKPSPAARETGDRYPFSYLAETFTMEWILTSRDNRITSVMLVSLRDGTLKVLYYFGGEAGDAITALKSRVAGSREVHALLLAHPDLLARGRDFSGPCLRLTYRPRFVGVSRKLLEQLTDEMIIQLGDGDSVFT